MNLPGSEAAIGGPLSNPGGSAMSAGFFELKASEPVCKYARRLSCETDHFEDYSLKLQCNSFNLREVGDAGSMPRICLQPAAYPDDGQGK
jgi:hypothetical protein